ncbi:APC family permease [Streptomyces sp. BH106]|uniref:APC family permease n=1 Tax=Streptomyces sp. BH106 TaxID=3410409 RepID=UPI003CF81E1C
MSTGDPLSRTGPDAVGGRLSGGLGAGAIVFMVVAAAAPLAVVGGVVPLAALLGNGAGVPGMFLISGGILLFFALGLSTMSRHVTKPGAFFTYVGYGLGRPAGMAAAWLALLTYTAAQIAVFAYSGLMLGRWVDGHGGPGLPWWLWSLALAVFVGILGHRRVELSSKVLGLLLIAEIGVVLILSVVILMGGGANGITADSFHPSVVLSGSPALALMLVMGGFSGFESTVIYRDEAREPERTIPRATYAAVVLITVFYTFTAWALVQGWGSGFTAAIAHDSSGFLVTTTSRFLGSAGAEVVNLLLLTSFFACALSFHNVIVRYQHAMANAGLLPGAVARVHTRHRSPYVSSAVQTTTVLALLGVFAVCRLDPYLKVYTWLGEVGTVAIIVLMALTSLAVITYLNRERIPAGPWRTWVAPAIGLAGLLAVAAVLLWNFPLLLGDADAAGSPRVGRLTIGFYALLAAFPAIGLAQAAWLRRARPAAYLKVIDIIST